MKYIFILLFFTGCNNGSNQAPKNIFQNKKSESVSTQSIIDSIKKSIPETDKSPENSEWRDNVYRNNKYKFRMVFPKDWVFDNGTTKHTIARAINKKDGATISILVQHISDAIANPNSIFENESENDLKSALEMLSPYQNKKFENFEIKKGYLNNFPAYITSMTQNVLSGEREIEYLTKQIKSHCESKIYQITLNVPVNKYNKYYSSIFTSVIDSFNFEIAY